MLPMLLAAIPLFAPAGVAAAPPNIWLSVDRAALQDEIIVNGAMTTKRVEQNAITETIYSSPISLADATDGLVRDIAADNNQGAAAFHEVQKELEMATRLSMPPIGLSRAIMD